MTADAILLDTGSRSEGPFRAGPVEVTGKAEGTGALTGTLSAPRADLLADIDAVDVPRLPLENVRLTLSFLRQANGSSGMIAAKADSNYGKAQARGDFRFPQGGVDLTNLGVDAGGLKAGEQVIVKGLQRVRPGQRVEPELVEITLPPTKVHKPVTSAAADSRPVATEPPAPPATSDEPRSTSRER